ncbi:MAG: biopolymer transporter ExbD [Bacteroidetes bacterium]|nr:biopolymer transporter ExbD [Bacteroidota bacterium]
MAKFHKQKSEGAPGINTASLPDIVFMLLFFFMVTTTIRKASLKVQLVLPFASEIQKIEKKSLVSYIYVGPPIKSLQSLYGTEPRIQLNDAFAKLDDLREFVIKERQKHDEKEVPMMTWSLKVDKDTKMGVVTDIKQKMRDMNALKIMYSAKKATGTASF